MKSLVGWFSLEKKGALTHQGVHHKCGGIGHLVMV